jgi:hypothetical protein
LGSDANPLRLAIDDAALTGQSAGRVVMLSDRRGLVKVLTRLALRAHTVVLESLTPRHICAHPLMRVGPRFWGYTAVTVGGNATTIWGG